MTAFVTTTVAIPAGGSVPYRGADWHDALVLVARGELEVRCRDGQRLRFGRGETLYLDGLPLLALHGRGAVATVLVAVRRSVRMRCEGVSDQRRPVAIVGDDSAAAEHDPPLGCRDA